LFKQNGSEQLLWSRGVRNRHMNGAAYSSFHRIVFRCLLNKRESSIIHNDPMLLGRMWKVTTPQSSTLNSCFKGYGIFQMRSTRCEGLQTEKLRKVLRVITLIT